VTTVDPSPAADGADASPDRHGAGFWIGFVIGGAIVAYGIRGVLTAPGGLRLADLARWVIGADLVHDFVLVPVAIGIGAVAVRLSPAALRPPLRFGLVASGVVVLLGWAPWRGYGAALVPDNPTVQPLDYTSAILTVLAVIWLGAAGWALARARSRARG
jgi:hypothetical protein